MFPKEKINFFDFDIYSRRISFFYENKERIGSLLGFILTTLYVILSIIFFLFYFIKTIKREDVTASESTIYPKSTPSIEINKENFYLVFGLEHPTKLTRFIDERIYYPEAVYVERIKENGKFVNKSETILNIERCDNKNFGKNYQFLFQKGELNNSYCLKDFNVTLSGGIKFNKMAYIRINIYPCVNSSENNNHCKPQDEINYYLTSNYFSILAKDIGLNPLNYSFPAMPIVQDIYSTIDKSLLTEFIIYFGMVEIDTDIGLFRTNIKKDKYLQYIRNYHSFFFIDKEGDLTNREILSIQIRLEDNVYFQKRTYIKMSQVFSTTGGYMQVFSTIFSLICLLSKKINLEKKLLNSLFNFNIKQRKIILCIEYDKKLDYNSSIGKGNNSNFIPYEAKKSIITNRKKKSRRNSIVILSKNDKISPIIQKSSTQQKHSSVKNLKKLIENNASEEPLNEIFRRVSKEKEDNINIIDKSKLKILNGEDNFNDYKINKIFEQKNEKKYISDFNLIKDFKFLDKGNCATIDFNIFDYYCLRKFTKKRTEIELFSFGINFYKSQMDIINFINIILLTQIMLTKQSENNQNILTQKIELSIN